MLTEIPEVKYIRYMRSHNSGDIQGENFVKMSIEMGQDTIDQCRRVKAVKLCSAS